MLETAIIGGGLCGISLARSRQRQLQAEARAQADAQAFALFEARPRLGGRILSVEAATAPGFAIDLGPTWFWPDTQPLVTRLIAELKLANFPQHDDGAVLRLSDPDKSPDVAGGGVHNGARRLAHGMAGLIGALAADLPAGCVHLGHVLTRLADRGDHVELTFDAAGEPLTHRARRVVLALPPRLLDEHVRFEPDLDDATRDAMRATGTWMAAQAKAVIVYDRPRWRDAGQSGNAFVTHEQAVLGEIFDACDGTAGAAALGGFLALSPELRQSFSEGLPMLLQSQMVQVFGPALDQRSREQHYRDWAGEPYTSSTLDRVSPQIEHFDLANPLLRRTLWNGKLFFGGSETASRGAGYLEGALEAAQRIERELARMAIPALPRVPPLQMETVAGPPLTRAALAGDAPQGNAASVEQFRVWVDTRRDATFDAYRRRLSRSLAVQQREQLTQRAALESMEEVFRHALDMLDSLPFDLTGVPVERGRSALTPEVQRPFRDFMQSFLDDVVAFNRTSCALSNFPDEHRPSKDYMQTILRDIAAAWQEFSLAANRLLLAKARSPAASKRPDARVSP